MTLSEHLRRGETRQAIQAARQLDRRIHEGSGAEPLDGLRSDFLGLLDLRGFRVRTPDEIAESVREIRDLGPGFDLYDLTEALAACDRAATDCRGLSSRRGLPELNDFGGRCGCSSPTEDRHVP